MCRRRAWEWCRRFWVLGHSRTSRRRRDRFVTRSNNNSNRLTNPFVLSFDRRIQQLLGATRKSKKNETKKKKHSLENVRLYYTCEYTRVRTYKRTHYNILSLSLSLYI
jgi:hypothetical protein